MATTNSNALEKRIADLLYVFRDECFDNGLSKDPESTMLSSASKRKSLALSRKQYTKADEIKHC